MSPNKDVKFPPLTRSQKQRATFDKDMHKVTVHAKEEKHERWAGVSAPTCSTRPPCWTGSSYLYAGAGRKPPLLVQLESCVSRELLAISPQHPQCEELKLQVYRNVFGCFISAFRTYQPLLSAIKNEYENALAHQQDQIQELRSHLRLMTEDWDRKTEAGWGGAQAEAEALKGEKQQLQRDMEALRQKEKATQTLVDHLQAELSNQYLQYREERDARRLLIGQLNVLTEACVVQDPPAQEDTEDVKDALELQLALKVCRGDLTQTQEQLHQMKAEYWGVVPQRDWDALERAHQQALQQLETLRGDFDLLRSEYDSLLEIYKRAGVHRNALVSTSVQTEEAVSESESHESVALVVQEFRTEQDQDQDQADAGRAERLTGAGTEAESNNANVLSDGLMNEL
ncbi:translin-associated factor X-interacting protein 1 isoform 1-T2 [Menidia menidia]